MTYQNYLNQADPQRLPIGSVEVTEKDLVTKHTVGENTLILLKYQNLQLQYVLTKHSDILYTTDKCGNKKRASVFKLTL